MKKTIGVLLSLVLVLICAFALADVEINETNFPDDNFREYLSIPDHNIDSDCDGILSADEIAAITRLDIFCYSISSLQGIEYFTALKHLTCNSNNLTSLDLSKNQALTDLYCNDNQLTTLDVSKNTALKSLDCNENQLTTLDVSENTALQWLNCTENQLTTLDVTNCVALKDIVQSFERTFSDGHWVWIVEQGSLCVDWNVTVIAGDYISQAPTPAENGVAIDETNFPDNSFRWYVSTFLDCDHDFVLNDDELADVTKISFEERSMISNLKGIEHFSALQELYCYDCELTMLDVSKNTELKILDCSGNKLTTLDVSKNNKLEILGCFCNNLKTLDVSKNTALTALECDSNLLTTLDISKNTALTALGCGSNPRLTTLDVSKNTALKSLYCFGNNLTTLDVSKNTALKSLYCYSNQLTTLDVSKNTELTILHCYSNQLTTLDVSKNTTLTELVCSFNPLSTLDISKNTALTELSCRENKLKTLDVSKNTALTYLVCFNNQLKTLDVSKNTALIYLDCTGNKLTTLDVSKNTALTDLDCGNNKLTTLEFGKNNALTSLFCFNNQLTKLDVSKNTALIHLNCDSNRLTTLEFGKNNALTRLSCFYNKLKMLDFTHVPALASLVKETGPTESYDTLVWMKDRIGGYRDLYLGIDKGVDVIAGEISKAKITAINAQVYTGKAIKPAVIVKYGGKKLTKGTDYTVSFKNNKKIGRATVTITGIGDYTGKKTVWFDIVPKAVKLSSLTAGKKELTVKWAKGSNITGYEIEYCLKKNFKDAKSVTIKKAATTKTILKKLEAKKTYYVRIRTYKTVNGKKFYSAWSVVKSKKTK